MNRKTTLTGIVALLAAISLSGCRYTNNRLADLADIFQVGVGATSENPGSGPLPPSLGLHVQATEFLNLGALHYHGVSAELDGRGLFAGRESRTRIGLGPYQRLKIDQDYENGSENYFKKIDGLWTKRMNSKEMRWWSKPAKELEYVFWSDAHHEGFPVMHRGWQYWANWNVEAAISEPFLTHLGFNVRLGFDPSEISDFVLGFLTIDFKRDDLNEEEFTEKQSGAIVVQDTGTAPGEPEPGPAPADSEPEEPTIKVRASDLLTIYFDYDQSNIRADQQDRMAQNIQTLKDNPTINVLLEGNCDERGTTEYNFALGERRAMAVMQAFIEAGIAPERIRTISRGEENPAAQGSDESAWALNRRTEFREWE